jgi:transcriptional regulator with XRE-family HTH domain
VALSQPGTRTCECCGARLARDNGDSRCSSCRRSAALQPPEVPREFWDAADMRSALGSWHIGRVIYAYRAHPWHGRVIPQDVVGGWLDGLTQPQVSRIESGRAIEDLGRLVRWAQVLRIPGELLWFKLPDDSGNLPGTLPAAAGHSAVAAIDDALGAGGELAALSPAVRGAERVSSGQVPEGTEDVNRVLSWLAPGAGAAGGDAWDVDDVERRELLRILGGVGLAAPFAGGGQADAVRRRLDGALNAPTTAADVAEWERVVYDYGMENGRVAPRCPAAGTVHRP